MDKWYGMVFILISPLRNWRNSKEFDKNNLRALINNTHDLIWV